MDVKELEARLMVMEDIMQIDRLEKIYGYYLDNQKFEEIVDLFSDDAESIEICDRGLFKGKEGIKRFFWGFLEKRRESSQAGRMAIHMQHQGVIDIAPDGKTGMGRWYLVMIQARPLEAGGPNKSVLGHGVYENEFVKEDGTWKFKKMFMSLTYRSPIGEGWTSIPNMDPGQAPGADAPSTDGHWYPNQSFVPFHWKHPITSQ